jgi:hypothetical protein
MAARGRAVMEERLVPELLADIATTSRAERCRPRAES